jgi:hypothetical protein
MDVEAESEGDEPEVVAIALLLTGVGRYCTMTEPPKEFRALFNCREYFNPHLLQKGYE